MKKATLNFVLDVGLLVSFLLTAISGLVLWLALPHAGFQGGRNPAYYQTFFFLNRAAWNDIHLWAGVLVGVIVAVHLALHWRWIVCMVKRYVSRATHAPIQEACPSPGS